jgi:uncharacterized repeat protein (TIGR01451 family)
MQRTAVVTALIAGGLLVLLSLARLPAAVAGAGQAGPEYGPSAPLQPSTVFTPTQLWRRCPAWYCETGWYASPAVADLNQDGQVDVLWGGYSLMAVNGATGAIEWIRPQGSSSRLWPGIAVADLLGNGALEVITGSGNGYLGVYNADGSPLAGWPRRADANELRSLAVADLEHDGQMEIVVASTNSSESTGGRHWWVYEPDGSVRPGWPRLQAGDPGYAAGTYNENVGVGDIDGDGRGEIIGPSDVHYITAYQDDGAQIGVNPIFAGRGQYWSQIGVHVDQAVDLRGYANCGVEARPNFANSAPAIGDLLGDGTQQIVVVGNVYNCGTDPYTDLYEMPFIFNPDRSRWSSGPFDWTVIPTPDSAAAPLSEDYALIENSVPNPVLADLDGDGRKEILYPSYDGRLHAYWLDKTEHGQWPFPVYNPAEGFFRFASEPAIVDLDHDGRAEVIFASWTQHGSGAPGRLHIVSWDGSLLRAIDLPRAAGGNWGGSLAAPTVANLDGDPNVEVVIGTVDSGVVAYRLAGTTGALSAWPTGRGSFRRTGTTALGSLSASTKSASTLRPAPGGSLTYTIHLANPGPLLPSARVTDTLPANANLVAWSVAASSGSWGVAGGVLTWAGPVTPSIGVTLTYVMTLNASLAQPAAIVNTALLDDGLGHMLSRTVVAFVNPFEVFMPLARR